MRELHKLFRMVRDILSNKVTFVQKPEQSEGAGKTDILWKSRLDSGNNNKGNEVWARIQYLRNSKELLELEGRKGKVIMKLERCWTLDDEGPEICTCLARALLSLTSFTIPTHLYTVCLRPSGWKSSCPLSLTCQSPQEAQDLSPGFYPSSGYVHHVFWPHLIPLPFHHLKHFHCAFSNSCSASFVNVHFILLKHLGLSKWYSFFPAVLWDGGSSASSPICLLLDQEVG